MSGRKDNQQSEIKSFCLNCGTQMENDHSTGGLKCPKCGAVKDGRNAETEKRVNITKCEGCGATMTFDPKEGILKCPYCGNTRKIEATRDLRERDFSEFDKAEKWTGNIVTVSCPNCGAVETYCESDVAKVCPFCKTPMVLGKDDIQGVKPNVVVPFKINADEALGECKKWIKKRIFAPYKFKKSFNFDSVKGIYYPIWTFDSNVITDYSGTLGRTVTRTRTRNGKTETYTTTEYFPVSGQMFDMFDDIAVNAGSFVDDSDVDAMTFSQKDYIDYSDEYLAGFSATGYTVKPQDAWVKAEAKMKKIIEREIMRRHNADTVMSLDMRLFHEGRSFKYMLVPFYVSAVRWNKKIYKQIIKGTGEQKVRGKTPLSPIRIGIAVLLGLGLLGLIIYLIMTGDGEVSFDAIRRLVSLLPA